MASFDTNGDFKDNYKWLIGSILPRPIAWVSTKNKDGSNNLAPFSFFTAISAKPMMICFCPMIRVSTGLKKDTTINIEREREFVINFVTEANYLLANQTSEEFPYGDDEIEKTGLQVLPSDVVGAVRVAESPIHFECKLRDILHYGEGAGGGSLITGEVVRVHVNDDLIDQGRIITSKFAPIGRGAGNDWFKTDSIIELERLMKSQIQK